MNSFEIYKKSTAPHNTKPISYEAINNQSKLQSSTLKGFLLNNNIKKNSENNEDSFEYILQNGEENQIVPSEIKLEKNAFDTKKAIKPIAIVAGATILSVLAISACVAKYSGYISKNKGVVRSPDLARNMNLVEEQDLAMYKLLRDPNMKNLLGLGAVGGFSLISLSAKTFVDGIKDIWIKKQNCDIDYDLQENLIEVENSVFSGKLNVINTLLHDSANYFKTSLDENKKDIKFKDFLSFKGDEDNKKDKENKKSDKLKPYLIAGLTTAAFCSILFLTFKNYQKTAGNYKSYLDKMEDLEIRKKIESALKISDKKNAINELMNIFKSINSNEKQARETLEKVKDITQEEINSNIEKLKDEQIFAQTPEALGGVYEKIQYYCYINQPRGHLYNWILNPENKWNKYLFISLSVVSSIGYIAKTAADAVKQVAVSRENSKSELNLRKRLVGVKVNNFKMKKMSALNPMISNYEFQKKKGKSKEELTELAQNILMEIKNGPPYVYD